MAKREGLHKRVKADVRTKIDSWWRQAYAEGQITFSFIDKECPESEAKAMHRKLQNWVRVLRRRPFERQELFAIMQACSLQNPKHGVVRIVRKRELMQHVPIDSQLRSGEITPLESKPKPTSGILKNMRKDYKKELIAESNTV